MEKTKRKKRIYGSESTIEENEKKERKMEKTKRKKRMKTIGGENEVRKKLKSTENLVLWWEILHWRKKQKGERKSF